MKFEYDRQLNSYCAINKYLTVLILRGAFPLAFLFPGVSMFFIRSKPRSKLPNILFFLCFEGVSCSMWAVWRESSTDLHLKSIENCVGACILNPSQRYSDFCALWTRLTTWTLNVSNITYMSITEKKIETEWKALRRHLSLFLPFSLYLLAIRTKRVGLQRRIKIDRFPMKIWKKFVSLCNYL